MKNNNTKPDAIIISDLHLGSPFAHTEKIVSFIESLSGDIKLIINGDILHEPSTRKLTKNGHAKTLKLLAERENVIFTAGNHDIDPETLTSLTGTQVHSKYILNSGGKKFLVTHGHILDEASLRKPVRKQRPRRKLGNALARLLYFLTRSHKPILALRRFFDRTASLILLKIFDYYEKAASYASSHECDGIIMGHMHRPELRLINNVMYCNSGSWVKTHDCTYLTVDNGKVTLHTF